MSKLKITIEWKEEQKQECKHEVGGVYFDMDQYWILIEINGKYFYLSLPEFTVFSGPPSSGYDSLELVDINNPNDIPVDAELIIREVQ